MGHWQRGVVHHHRDGCGDLELRHVLGARRVQRRRRALRVLRGLHGRGLLCADRARLNEHALSDELEYIYLFVVECTTLVLHETPFVVQSSGVSGLRWAAKGAALSLQTCRGVREEREKSFASS